VHPKSTGPAGDLLDLGEGQRDLLLAVVLLERFEDDSLDLPDGVSRP
jgi:hypothetical protein